MTSALRLCTCACAGFGLGSVGLADVIPSPTETLGGWRNTPGMGQDLLTVVGMAMVLLGLLMFWARFLRRRKRQRRHSDAVVADGQDENRQEQHHSHRHRHRRRRREHRGRNPTLAETGGLPPPRSPDSAG